MNSTKTTYRNVSIPHNNDGLVKQNFQNKIVNIFLSISFIICFACSNEQSFEYPQNMF